jgi:hypothetical protein
VASQCALFQNTLFGKARFHRKGSGASFQPAQATSHLHASGQWQVADAQLATLDVGRLATDAVNRALQGIEEKIPDLKGKKLATPANNQSGFEKITASFTIANGVFSMPDFTAVSGRHRGFDVKGNTEIGLKKYDLKASWNLIDTNDLTGARKIAIESNGVRVDPLFAEPNQPVQFPVLLSGTLFSPTPSYTAVPEALGRVAFANIQRAAVAKVKSEASARVQSEIKKLEQKAPPVFQKAIEDIGKRFKF